MSARPVESILEWSGMSQTLQFPSDHPALAGHFHGRPIVPGVVLLDHVMLAAAAYLAERDGGQWRIAQAPAIKFQRPVLPEEPLQVTFEGPGERLRFRLTLADEGQTAVASGTLAGLRE